MESGAQQLAADEFAGEAGGGDGDRLGVGADDDESAGGGVVVVGEAFVGLGGVDHAVLVPGDQGAGVRVVDFVVLVVADQGLDVGHAVAIDVGQEQGVRHPRPQPPGTLSPYRNGTRATASHEGQRRATALRRRQGQAQGGASRDHVPQPLTVRG